jgi:hypothetical protein
MGYRTIGNIEPKEFAFPHKENIGGQHHAGLTKREYFTSMAMPIIKPTFYVGKKETEESLQEWAEKCVRMADAILKELSK